MQPGADAVGFISCTGTNFLIRANAFQKVRAGLNNLAKTCGSSLFLQCTLVCSDQTQATASQQIDILNHKGHWHLYWGCVGFCSIP